MKKTIIYTLLALLATGVQSCFFSEKDIFDESASNRMEATLDEFRTMLTDAPNGWILEFYAGEGHDEGGVVLLMRFEGEKVTVASDTEVLDFVTGDTYAPGTEMSSLFELIEDQGPVLSFDTYNVLIHNWSEPKGNADVDGYAGDYEFVIMSGTENRFELKGKKRNVKMQMTRLDAGTTWEEYINSCLAIRKESENYSTLVGYDGGKKFLNSAVCMGNIFTLTKTDTAGNLSREKISYVYTDKGLRFYEPTKINGVECYSFAWNEASKIFVSEENPSVELRYEQPADYVPIEYYIDNKWALSFTTASETGDVDTTLTLSFKPVAGTTDSLRTSIFDFDIKAFYNKATGMIEFQMQFLDQVVFTNGTTGYIYLCPNNSATGTAYLSEKTGVVTYTQQIEPRIFTFIDNGRVPNTEIDGFSFLAFSKPELNNNTILGYINTFSNITLSKK